MRRNYISLDRMAALNDVYAKLAVQAGIAIPVDRTRRTWRLPPNLDPNVAWKARLALEGTGRYFRSLLQKGDGVFWVTVCHPEWLCGRNELTPDLVQQVVKWTQRRVQRLRQKGQPVAAGAIDISWNDNTALGLGKFWCVHVHLLIAVVGSPAACVEAALRKALKCPKDERITGNGPVYIKSLDDQGAIADTLRYASGAMALSDHNQQKLRHHRKRIASKTAPPADRILGSKRRNELTRLFNQVGPNGFLVLSGLQRRGGEIREVSSRVSDRFTELRAAQSRAKAAHIEAKHAIERANAAAEAMEPDLAVASMIARVTAIAAEYHQTRVLRLEGEVLARNRRP